MSGLMYREDVVVASAAKTATGNSGVIDINYGDLEDLRAQLDVTGQTGGVSPTLDVLIEDTLDGTNWNTLMTFTQATGITREILNLVTPFARRLRVSWTLVDTTNFTFSVVLVARRKV